MRSCTVWFRLRRAAASSYFAWSTWPLRVPKSHNRYLRLILAPNRVWVVDGNPEKFSERLRWAVTAALICGQYPARVSSTPASEKRMAAQASRVLGLRRNARSVSSTRVRGRSAGNGTAVSGSPAGAAPSDGVMATVLTASRHATSTGLFILLL